MQRIYMIGLMTAAGVLMFGSFLYSLRQKSREGRAMSGVLLSASAVQGFYIPALYAPSAMCSAVFFSLYFLANFWLCLAFFLFGWFYTGHKAFPKWVPAIGWIWTVLDHLSMLLNPLTHHAAVFKYTSARGITFRSFDMRPAFYEHLLLCYILLGLFGFSFLERILHAHKIYRIRYSVILGILVLSTLANGLFLMTSDQDFDLSVVLYGFGGMLIYYFSFNYLPRKLVHDIGGLVLKQMDLALLFYDQEGKCLYQNEQAQRLTGSGLDAGQEKQLCEMLRLDHQAGRERQISRLLLDGQEQFFRVGVQQFFDEKRQYLGCAYQLENITVERNENLRRMYLATHDPLTGIYNRATFYEKAQEVLEDHPQVQYSIIATNIWQFKMLNDLLGRESGDELLRVIGRACADHEREDVVFGRLESDKFVICAPSGIHLEERLDRSVQEKFEELHEKYNLSIQLTNFYGVYEVTEQTAQIADMCDRAGMALLTLPDGAGSRVAFYDEKLRQEKLRDSQLTAQLPQAVRDGQFILHFQPQFDSRSSRIVGAEALVRWQHPQYGMIPPDQFIPLLEQTALIYRLDQYVWETACQVISGFLQQGYQLPISVNVSPRDIYSADVYQTLTELVAGYGIPSQLLKLEITETAAIADSEKVTDLIKKLQAQGFQVEMDDFGSGFSSLNTLKRIPVDVLKLDRSFIADALDSGKGMKILRTVTELAGALGMPLIAEGVEEKAQVDFLQEIGCHNIQGYYYSRPVPLLQLQELLEQHEIGELA